MMKVKYYTCPVCKKKYKTLNGWGDHMDQIHPNERPEGYSTSRFFYYVKTGKTHGACRTCKGPTSWNEISMKYLQFCDNPKCKEEYVKIAKSRMIKKYGKPHLLDEPDTQKKMLDHRHITGVVRFHDGNEIKFVGSYEKQFLNMINDLLEWPSNDIISPSPHVYYYDYKNEKDENNEGKKFYIPDFYIPSLNLEIEIKQQTSTNKAFNEINRVKEKLKDEIMMKNKHVNYIKINDNDFREFFTLLEKLKEEDPIEVEKAMEGSILISNETKLSIDDYIDGVAIESYKEYETPYEIEMIRVGYGKDGEANTIVKIKGEDRQLRYRSEMMIINKDKDKLFINFRRKGGYSFPGGGLDPDEDPMDTAIRETQEEVRMNVGNVRYGNAYVGFYDHIPIWMKNLIKEEDWWEGFYTTTFIGEFKSEYTGHIDEKDKDDMIHTGKWVNIKDIYPTLNRHHQKILLNYLGSIEDSNQSSINENNTLDISMESDQEVIDMIENYYQSNGIKYKMSKSDIEKFISGKDDSIFILSHPDYKKIKNDLTKFIGDDYSIKEDNYNTLYLKRKTKLEVANESIFKLFNKRPKEENDHRPWKEILFNGKGILGINPKRYGVKIKDGIIEFHGISVHTLKNRIAKFYGDKSIYQMFLPEYNLFDYRKFKKKKISRSQMRIEYLYTYEFFALELVCLFTDLGSRFRDKNYLGISSKIYRDSWLAEADKKAEITPLLDTSRLSNIAFTLNDYQKDFIEKYPKLKAQLNLRGYILAFEQGLGKTLTAISLSECLNVDHVYIVCPNSLKENWALEIQKYYEKYQDEDLWRQEVFICSNNPMYFHEDTTKFLIINNESIEKMFPYVMNGKNMLILDESHNFRNIESKRVNQLLQLRDRLHCIDTLIMSGTPIKATPDEIVPALMMIDPTFNIDAAKAFTKAFKLKSSIGTSLVQSRFGKIMYRKEKDVLEGKLPQKFIESLPLKIHDSDKYLMSNVNKVVMDRFREIFLEGYNEFKKLEKPFLEMSKIYGPSDMDFFRFQKIITEMVKRGNSVHEIDQDYVELYMKRTKASIRNVDIRNKYDELIKGYVRYQAHCLGLAFGEILPPYRRDMFISLYDENKILINKMIMDNVKKTLIFTQFKGVANHIHASLLQSGIGSVIITGDVKDRMTVLKEFKEDDTIRVLVATSQTIGTGVTLVEANQMFFFGPPWRDSDFEQCSDRIHRIGQTDDCHIYTVTLDTENELNLSTRMDNILSWSKHMTESVIIKTDDEKNIDENNFEELLKASESLLIPEFLCIRDDRY